MDVVSMQDFVEHDDGQIGYCTQIDKVVCRKWYPDVKHHAEEILARACTQYDESGHKEVKHSIIWTVARNDVEDWTLQRPIVPSKSATILFAESLQHKEDVDYVVELDSNKWSVLQFVQFICKKY